MAVHDRVTLTAGDAGMPLKTDGSRMAVTDPMRNALGLEDGSIVAFIADGRDVVIKRAVLAEFAGECPQIRDSETPTVLTRTYSTNPTVEDLLSNLKARAKKLRPVRDPVASLADTSTLPGWLARRLSGRPAASDDQLQVALISEREQAQGEDGAWDGSVVVTARVLRELAALGRGPDNGAVRRAIDWLIRRPGSEYNPGQWFATDELVAEQASVIASRLVGSGGRFRATKASEKKHIMRGDGLVTAPCGPRIMWPNAFVIETLVGLGYEDHPRVQAALNTLTMREWCECGYQHGTSSWRNAGPVPDASVAAYEDRCELQFHYGGYADPAWLIGNDAPPRIEMGPESGSYVVALPDHVQGCEFITTRALAQVHDTRVRRFAQAHLWRFAAIQRRDGTYPAEKYGTGFGLIGILDAVSRYDHPASRIILLRSLPRIVEAQNADGSWGNGVSREWETLAVLRVLQHPAFASSSGTA